VRHHGSTARIEVEPTDFSLVYERESEIAAHLTGLGFAQVEIDPLGYRTGVSVPEAGRSDPQIRSLSLPVLTLK
jgi:PP-loop superfamily ATP-utilizing enzyme